VFELGRLHISLCAGSEEATGEVFKFHTLSCIFVKCNNFIDYALVRISSSLTFAHFLWVTAPVCNKVDDVEHGEQVMKGDWGCTEIAPIDFVVSEEI
jgi:hypothetical protein